MGFFDAIKGLLSGDGLSGVLEPTGLSEQVEGLGLDGVTEILPDVLPEGLGDVPVP